MKKVKVILVTVMLGLAVGLLPKASWAADISVGFFMGLPVPVVTVAPPPVHHSAGYVLTPVTEPAHWQAYGPDYRYKHHHRVNWNNGRHDRDYGFRDNDRRYDHDRSDRDGGWDRR